MAMPHLPCDDIRHQQDRQADSGGGHGIDADGPPEDPQPHRDGERTWNPRSFRARTLFYFDTDILERQPTTCRDLLVQRHGSELGQLLLGRSGGVWRVLDLGRVERVEDEGHGDQADQARDERSQGPRAPRDADAGAGSQVDSQGVGGQGWEGGGRR